LSGPSGGLGGGDADFSLEAERQLSESEESGPELGFAAEPEFEIESSGLEFTPQLSSGFEIEEPTLDLQESGFELAGPGSPEPEPAMEISEPAIVTPG